MPRSPILSELRFVVVGAEGSGKTTFIRYALDLKKPMQGPVASKKMSLEGDVFLISLMEIQLNDVDTTADNTICWPDSVTEGVNEGVNEGISPPVNGVLVLYDVSERSSLAGIPSLLTCKCDTPPPGRKVDPREIERSCMKETGIEGCQTFLERPETHKRCISVVLRNVISNDSALIPAARPRAMTATPVTGSNSSSQSQAQRLGHSRAASEATMQSRVDIREPSSRLGVDSKQRSHGYDGAPNSASKDQSRIEKDPSKESLLESSDDVELEVQDNIPKKRNSHDGQDSGLLENSMKSRLSAPPGTPTTIANSFLEYGSDEGDDDTLLQENDDAILGETTSIIQDTRSVGYEFDELVDRLVALPMSKADSKFIATFLCLYRKFAAPAQLMSAICKRFEALSNNGEPQLLRIGAQFRHLTILAHWVAEYPGDFAHPITRYFLTKFINQMSNNRMFAAAAGEMDAQMDVVVENDDTLWACSDHNRGQRVTLESFLSVPSMQENAKSMMKRPFTEAALNDSELSSRDEDTRDRRIHHAKTPSSASNHERSNSISVPSSFSTALNSVEATQRQAELLHPIARNPLNKIHWHQFMELSDDDIAREMTRIDWIMYTAIRPRDLIRHVSLAVDQKEKCRSLEHVNRMINQFNHVAFWVANMVLLRDKAKHRAKALEKFMGIAWKLRQMNNYNSLGAVIAGINGTAVHRLLQTRELVSQQAQKDFMRLEILMGTQRSHFAYRLAWENTLSEKIPFLPLHRRDLVSAEEGNRTFIGDNQERVNWRKFEIIGEAIMGIQKSQGMPYPHIPRNMDVQRLILEGKFSKDDDELYERSLQLEGPGANEPRRRFNWFQR